MVAIVRSELAKILTLPSVWIVTGLLLLLTLFLQIQGYRYLGLKLETVDENGMLWWYASGPVPADLEIVADMGAQVFNPGIFFPVLGAVIAGAEFRSGEIGLTFVAVPQRIRLVLCKAIATAMFALSFGVVVTGMTVVSTYLAVRDWQPRIMLLPEAISGLTGSVVFVVAITLVSFGVTLIVRGTLIGIVVVFGFTGIVMTQVLQGVSPVLDSLTPMSAARNWLLQGAEGWGGEGPAFSSVPEVGMLVLLGWAVLAPVTAALVLKVRDAR